MKNLLILGAGTAGTMMANHLHKKLPVDEWRITLMDVSSTHYYQPGFLFMPFGIYTEEDVIKPKADFLPKDVSYLQEAVERIEPDQNRVVLNSGKPLSYDILIVATGCHPVPDEVEGMTGSDWRDRVHEFYTFKGTVALTRKLQRWTGGDLVVHICETPIKCPVAPLEFIFLADAWLQERGLRDTTTLTYVTPLSGAFTKPVASRKLSGMLKEKNIRVVHDFSIERVDNESHTIVSYDGKEVPYDLLVTVPPNMGSEVIERSGLGDEMNYVPTDPHTLQSKAHPNLFVIGDATDVPTSKAGSVAHFESEVLTTNILHFIRGEPLEKDFDGHANCFLESGHGKACLLDFNYDQEPVGGTYPIPVIGPFTLMEPTRVNHWGKLAFRSVYWNVLLKALPLPGIGHHMSYSGKKLEVSETAKTA